MPELLRTQLEVAFTGPYVGELQTVALPFADSFDRENAATLGAPWEISLGTGVTAATAGVESNMARILTIAGAGYAAALVDRGSPDFTVQFTVRNTPVTAGRWYFRAADAENAIVGRVNGSNELVITKLAPGADVNVFASTVKVPVGTVLRSKTDGDTMTIHAGDTLVWTGTATVAKRATKAGFGTQSAANVGRVDDFSITF